jgi:peptide deformylase
MALLEILTYPDPRLRIVAQPITTIDAELKKIVEDMIETMYHAQGVGLAGTQVNIHKRIFTMDASENHDQPVVVLNPEILSRDGVGIESEGCLSVPGAYDKADRALTVRMRGMDMDGKIFEWDADGLIAHVIQHEVDHLNGMLFIDYLSKLKQSRIRKKIEKAQR